MRETPDRCAEAEQPRTTKRPVDLGSAGSNRPGALVCPYECIATKQSPLLAE